MYENYLVEVGNGAKTMLKSIHLSKHFTTALEITSSQWPVTAKYH